MSAVFQLANWSPKPAAINVTWVLERNGTKQFDYSLNATLPAAHSEFEPSRAQSALETFPRSDSYAAQGDLDGRHASGQGKLRCEKGLLIQAFVNRDGTLLFATSNSVS